MKVLFLILTIFIVNAWCKQRCYPIQDQALKPKPRVIISDEACPDQLPKVKEFNVERAKGDWYIIEAYPNAYHKGLSCYRENNVPSGPSKYIHTFCEKYGINSCSIAELNHVDGDGKFSYDLGDGTQGFGYYLDIDYDNYYITYLCDNLPEGKSQRSLFIASRTRTLSEALRQKAYNKIESADFSTKPFENIEQNEKFCADQPNVIVSDKSCPATLPRVKSFDVQQLAGKWFVVKTYRSFYFVGMDCFTMTFVPTGPYIYDNTLCEKFNGTEKCGVVHALKHANQDGEFTFNLPDGTGYYLHIDYKTYYIFYVCDNLENGGSQIIVSIVSRTQKLSDALLAEAHGRIEAAGLSVDALETVNQDEEFCGRT